MKKILFVLMFFMKVCLPQAQNKQLTVIKDLEYWRNDSMLKYFPHDLDTLSRDIDTLNTRLLTPFKDSFDICRQLGKNNAREKEVEKSLRNLIDLGKLLIQESIDTIKSRDFYGKRELNKEKRQDSSFLFYYTNAELNDYLQSLYSLQQEMNLLLPFEKHLNSFTINNFLNSYYFMCESRSLLFAAIDNLERYYNLGEIADNIQKTTDSNFIVSDALNIRTKRMDTNVLSTKTNLLHIDSLLSQSFHPYYPVNSKLKKVIDNSSDKISSSANTILFDQRKNWWWRTLIGGIAAGLVAGLVVLSFK